MDFYQKKMVNRYEQVQCYSKAEIERRWASVRSLMQDKALDMLIMVNPAWEGAAQWMLGIENSRRCEYIIVPPEGEIIAAYDRQLVDTAANALPNALDVTRTVWNKPMQPVHENVRYCSAFDIADVKRHLPQKTGYRIGIFNYGYMRADFRDYLLSHIAGAELVNVSSDIHMLKAIKSPEELELMHEADKLNEKVLHAIPSIARVGRTLLDVNRDMIRMALELGSGTHLMHEVVFAEGIEGEAPQASRVVPCGFPGRVLEPGMRIFCISETHGIGGIHTAIARPVVIDGEPCEESQRAWEVFLKAQDNAASMLKPGVRLQDIYNANYKFINDLGYQTNVQQYIHGIGYVYAERPYLHDREDCNTSFLPMQENMTVIVHPVIISKYYGSGGRTSIFGVDTFRVTPQGGVRTNNFPRRIIHT